MTFTGYIGEIRHPYRVLAIDPADFYALTPRRPLAGELLSAHPCRCIAIEAFHAASDVPREDMVVLQYAGAVTTILAHSDERPRRVALA